MHEDETLMPSLKGARVLVVQNDLFVAADLDLMIDEAGVRSSPLPPARRMRSPCLIRSPSTSQSSIRIWAMLPPY
jgi:hypothetical protein